MQLKDLYKGFRSISWIGKKFNEDIVDNKFVKHVL